MLLIMIRINKTLFKVISDKISDKFYQSSQNDRQQQHQLATTTTGVVVVVVVVK